MNPIWIGFTLANALRNESTLNHFNNACNWIDNRNNVEFYVNWMHVIAAHETMFLHDVFQHHCKSLCNQQYIFLYQNNANRKPGGGLGGNRGGTEGVIHTIWKFLKKKNGRGPTGTGTMPLLRIFCKKQICLCWLQSFCI